MNQTIDVTFCSSLVTTLPAYSNTKMECRSKVQRPKPNVPWLKPKMLKAKSIHVYSTSSTKNAKSCTRSIARGTTLWKSFRQNNPKIQILSMLNKSGLNNWWEKRSSLTRLNALGGKNSNLNSNNCTLNFDILSKKEKKTWTRKRQTNNWQLKIKPERLSTIFRRLKSFAMERKFSNKASTSTHS